MIKQSNPYIMHTCRTTISVRHHYTDINFT